MPYPLLVLATSKLASLSTLLPTSTDIILPSMAYSWATGRMLTLSKYKRMLTTLVEILMNNHRNPKLTAGTGSLLYDQPHVHVDVTADFYMFTPV